MKQIQIVLGLLGLLLSSSLLAASHVCTQGKAERKINVIYAGENKAMPCDVKYQKEGETEGTIKWSAKVETDYCETKADEFAEKLKEMGWVCNPQ
jgi:hypothetical protein